MLIFRRCLLVFVLAIACTISSFAVAEAASNYGVKSWNKTYLSDNRKWNKQRWWKAVAVSRVYNNWQSCGHAWSYQDKAIASKDALKRCVQYYRKFSRKSKTGCHVTILTR